MPNGDCARGAENAANIRGRRGDGSTMPRLSMIPAWMPEEVTRYISVSLPGDCRMQCPYCLSGAHTRTGLPRVIMCRAGIDACCVWFDGRVTRCGSMAASAADDDMGNLYEDGHIRWLTEEHPCPIGYCPCGQLHALHVEP